MAIKTDQLTKDLTVPAGGGGSGSSTGSSLADLESGLEPQESNCLADTYNEDLGTKVGLKIDDSALIYQENILTGSHELTKEVTAQQVKGSGVVVKSLHSMRPDNVAIQVGVPLAGKNTITLSGDVQSRLPDTKPILWAKRNLVKGVESYIFLVNAGQLEKFIVESTTYTAATDKTDVVVVVPNGQDFTFGLAATENEHRLRLFPFDDSFELAVAGNLSYVAADIVDANALQVKRILQNFSQDITVPEQLLVQKIALTGPGAPPAAPVDVFGSVVILNMGNSPSGQYVLLKTHHRNPSPAYLNMPVYWYSKDYAETFHLIDRSTMTMKNFGNANYEHMGTTVPYYNRPIWLQVNDNGKFYVSNMQTAPTYNTEFCGYGDLSDEVVRILGVPNNTVGPDGYADGLTPTIWPRGGLQASGGATHHYPQAIGHNKNGDGYMSKQHAGNSSSQTLHRRNQDDLDFYLNSMGASHNVNGNPHFTTVVGSGKHHIYIAIFRSTARWDYHETLEQDAVARSISLTGLPYGNAVGPSYPGTVAGAGFDTAVSVSDVIDWFMNDTYIIGFYNRNSGGVSGADYLAYRYIEHQHNNPTLFSKFETGLDGWTIFDGVPDAQPIYISDFRTGLDGWTEMENVGRGISESDAQRNDVIHKDMIYQCHDNNLVFNHRSGSLVVVGTFPEFGSAPMVAKVITGLTPGDTYQLSFITKELTGSSNFEMIVYEGNDISSRSAIFALPELLDMNTNTTAKTTGTFVAPAGGEVVLTAFNAAGLCRYAVSSIVLTNHNSGTLSGKVYSVYDKLHLENPGGATGSHPFIGRTITGLTIGQEYYVMYGIAELSGATSLNVRVVDGVHLTSGILSNAEPILGFSQGASSLASGFTFIPTTTTVTIYAQTIGVTTTAGSYVLSDILVRKTPVWSEEKQLTQNYDSLHMFNGTNYNNIVSMSHTEGSRVRSVAGDDSHVFFACDVEAYNGNVSAPLVFEIKDITNHLGIYAGPTVGNYNSAHETGLNFVRGSKIAYTFDETGQEMANIKCFSLRSYQELLGRGATPETKDDKWTVRLKDTNVAGTGSVIQEFDVFMRDATHGTYPGGDIHYFNLNAAARAIMATQSQFHLEIEASWGIDYRSGDSAQGYLQITTYSGNLNPNGSQFVFLNDNTWVAGTVNVDPIMSWHDHYIHKMKETGQNEVFPNVNNSYTQCGMSQIETIGNKLKMISRIFPWDDDQVLAQDHGGHVWGKEVVIDATDESSFKDAPEADLVCYDTKGNKAMGDPNLEIMIAFGSDEGRSRGSSGRTTRDFAPETSNIGAGEFAHGRKRQTVTALLTTDIYDDERNHTGKKMFFNGTTSQIQIAENISSQQYLYNEFCIECEFEATSALDLTDNPILSNVSSTFYPNIANVDVDMWVGVDKEMRPCIKSGNIKTANGRGLGLGDNDTEFLNTVSDTPLAVGEYYRLRFMRDLTDGFFKIFVSTGDAITAGPNEEAVYTEVTYINQNENGVYATVYETGFEVDLDGWQLTGDEGPGNVIAKVGATAVVLYTEDFSGGLNGWVETSDSNAANSVSVVGGKMRATYAGAPDQAPHIALTGLTGGVEYQLDLDITKIAGAAGGGWNAQVRDGSIAVPATVAALTALPILNSGGLTGTGHISFNFTPTGTTVMLNMRNSAQFGTWDTDNIVVKTPTTETAMRMTYAAGAAAVSPIAYKHITVKPNVWHEMNPRTREVSGAMNGKYQVYEGHLTARNTLNLAGSVLPLLSDNNDGSQAFQNPRQQFKSKSGLVTLMMRPATTALGVMDLRNIKIIEHGFNIGCGNIQWQVGKTNGPTLFCEGYIGYVKLVVGTKEFAFDGFQPFYTIQHPQMTNTGKIIGMKRLGDGNGAMSDIATYYEMVGVENTTPYADSNDVQLYIEKDFGIGNDGNDLAYKETTTRGDKSVKTKTQGVKINFSK